MTALLEYFKYKYQFIGLMTTDAQSAISKVSVTNFFGSNTEATLLVGVRFNTLGV